MKLENEMGVQDLADQGFCRPRVLILCPYRGTAFKIIESIKNILGDNTSMSNKEKFEEEFGPPDDDSDEEEEDEEEEEEENEKDSSSSKNKKKGKGKGKNAALKKPDDWKALFKGAQEWTRLCPIVRYSSEVWASLISRIELNCVYLIHGISSRIQRNGM